MMTKDKPFQETLNEWFERDWKIHNNECYGHVTNIHIYSSVFTAGIHQVDKTGLIAVREINDDTYHATFTFTNINDGTVYEGQDIVKIGINHIYDEICNQLKIKGFCNEREYDVKNIIE